MFVFDVERVIGNIRQKYSILGSTQPIDFVSSGEGAITLDKIVCVTCGLINICKNFPYPARNKIGVTIQALVVEQILACVRTRCVQQVHSQMDVSNAWPQVHFIQPLRLCTFIRIKASHKAQLLKISCLSIAVL